MQCFLGTEAAILFYFRASILRYWATLDESWACPTFGCAGAIAFFANLDENWAGMALNCVGTDFICNSLDEFQASLVFNRTCPNENWASPD